MERLVLRVGLTGGLACGKTTVARMFAERGLKVIEADQIAHELMRPGNPVYYDVVAKFGEGILQAGLGSPIDRGKLAAMVFAPGDESSERGMEARVGELNAIVHPAVIRAQEQWMDEIAAEDPHGIAVVEAALIFEAGVPRRFDKLVVVTCSREQKLERYAARIVAAREAEREAASPKEREAITADARRDGERRIAQQIPDENKAQAADIVIDNSGALPALREQVDAAVERLREWAK
jgi:dephospho-CoA kinase